VFWLLLGVLAVAGALTSLGGAEIEANPSTKSMGPSGLRTFAELLRREGIPVETDRRRRPTFEESDLVITFGFWNSGTFAEESEAFNKIIGDHVNRGGRTISVLMDRNFAEASRAVLDEQPIRLRRADTGSEAVITAAELPIVDEREIRTRFPVSRAIWTSDEGEFLRICKSQNGLVGKFADGMVLTNRYIAQQDNATVAVDIIRTLLPKGGRVVFAEASFGNVNRQGLLATIGPWAQIAWYQTLFLLLVIGYTLGKPFGNRETDRTVQRGTRELVNAFAFFLKRAHPHPEVLGANLELLETRMRKMYGLPQQATDGELERVLPQDVWTQLLMARAAAKRTDNAGLALRELQSLDRLLEEEVGRARVRTAKPR
jgi:hypothetical protein